MIRATVAPLLLAAALVTGHPGSVPPVVTDRAVQVAVPDDVLDLSADGNLALTASAVPDPAAGDDTYQTCLGPIDDAAAATCVTHTSLPRLGELSPDGAHYVVSDDIRRLGSGTAAIVDVATSAVTPVVPPSVPAGQQPVSLLGFVWTGDGQLVGWGPDRMVTVDPATGATEPLGEPLAEGEGMYWVVPAQSKVIAEVNNPRGRTFWAVVADPATGATQRFPIATTSSRVTVLDVSADATRVLVSDTDMARFVPGPTRVITLADGAVTEIPLPDDAFTLAGGFSDDEQSVALVVARKQMTTEARLLVGPLDGTAPEDVGVGSKAAFGRLEWDGDVIRNTGLLAIEPSMWRLAQPGS